MKKLYPAVSLLLSATLVTVLFLYIKFICAFLFGRAYYQVPFGLISELISVAIAYVLVESIINRWKLSLNKKAIILVILVVIPVVIAKLFL